MVQPAEGLYLHRASSITVPVHGLTHPAFCVIAQGSKEIRLGDERYQYDPYHYLLATFELPVVSQLLEATPERPYLSLRLQLDSALVTSVMLKAGIHAPQKSSAAVRAVDVSPLEPELLDAAVRLMQLLDAPEREARVLQPLVRREIVLRLLAGEQGNRLRHLALMGGQRDRIATALERLRSDFSRPLRIESLAREVGMSRSGFHEHFKSATAMSPLQFQKHLRLQEARRLMLGEDIDAGVAAFRVGYEDPSHFSRDYKKRFGDSPARDVEKLRASGTTALLG